MGKLKDMAGYTAEDEIELFEVRDIYKRLCVDL